jgi:23S rRNA pseudouridine2605 synthase
MPAHLSEKKRLAKILADRGVCSRRTAEKYILLGHVTVNGKHHTNLTEKISPDSEIKVKGLEAPKQQKLRAWIFHKPPEMLCTHHDPENRLTVFSYLKKHHPSLPRVISVGRLDYLSEGLLILTNSGRFAREMELPKNALKRCYDVKVGKSISAATIDIIKKGITIEGVFYNSISVKPLEKGPKWYRFVLKEGKNREIRRILSHFNIPLARLKRISYGSFHLGQLKQREIQEIPFSNLKDYQK